MRGFGYFLALLLSIHWGYANVADLVEAGASEEALSEIKAGVDVNAAQADGTTALHWASYHENSEVVDALLNAGAHADSVNDYEICPLYLACELGNAAIAKRLIDAGADVNATIPGGQTMLMTAVRTGVSKVVEHLLNAGADIAATERSGQDALMWAAAEGHSKVVEILIDAGADSAITLSSGFNSLFFAARNGHLETVRALLDAGMDVNQTIQPSENNRHKRARTGSSALILAIENGHFELALELVKLGADPNDQRSTFAPLHTLSWVRKPNSGDGADGDPPPQIYGEIGTLDFVKALVELGADVNLRLNGGRPNGRGRVSKQGATPFFMAADTADIDYMRLLLELGADPHIPNEHEVTPLMVAAGLGTFAPTEEAGTEEEALEAVELCLELGMDINHIDVNGETAMHGASYASWPEMVQYLYDHGADIEIWNRINKHEWSPLLIAQGYRPGNFKPSYETVAVFEAILATEGVTLRFDPPNAQLGYED